MIDAKGKRRLSSDSICLVFEPNILDELAGYVHIAKYRKRLLDLLGMGDCALSHVSVRF